MLYHLPLDEWYEEAAIPELPAQSAPPFQINDGVIPQGLSKVQYEVSAPSAGALCREGTSPSRQNNPTIYSDQEFHHNTNLTFVAPDRQRSCGIHKPDCEMIDYKDNRSMMMMMMMTLTSSSQQYQQQQPQQNHAHWRIDGRTSVMVTEDSAMGTSEIVGDHIPSNVTFASDTSTDHTESLLTTKDGVSALTVTPHDVVFGRGKYQRAHEGNEAMRALVYSIHFLYEQCLDRDDKTSITRYIVTRIQQNGGRFLKYSNKRQGWFIVSDEEARQKVSHVMRDAPMRKHRRTHGIQVSPFASLHTARLHSESISPASLKLSAEDADFLIGLFSR